MSDDLDEMAEQEIELTIRARRDIIVTLGSIIQEGARLHSSITQNSASVKVAAHILDEFVDQDDGIEEFVESTDVGVLVIDPENIEQQIDIDISEFENDMKRVTLRMTKGQRDEIDELVETGEFPSRSEAIRGLVREALNHRADSNSDGPPWDRRGHQDR